MAFHTQIGYTFSCFRIHVEHISGELALVFENIEKKDKGNYTCIADVDGQKQQAYFTLIVRSKYIFVNDCKK